MRDERNNFIWASGVSLELFWVTYSHSRWPGNFFTNESMPAQIKTQEGTTTGASYATGRQLCHQRVFSSAIVYCWIFLRRSLESLEGSMMQCDFPVCCVGLHSSSTVDVLIPRKQRRNWNLVSSSELWVYYFHPV